MARRSHACLRSIKKVKAATLTPSLLYSLTPLLTVTVSFSLGILYFFTPLLLYSFTPLLLHSLILIVSFSLGILYSFTPLLLHLSLTQTVFFSLGIFGLILCLVSASSVYLDTKVDVSFRLDWLYEKWMNLMILNK